jgi:hypothetical protein
MKLFGRVPAFPRAREIRDVLRASPLPPERSNWDLDADRLRAAADAEDDPTRRARLLEALRRRLHVLMRADGRPPRGAHEELATGPDGEPMIVWRQETYGADGRILPVRRPGYPRR